MQFDWTLSIGNVIQIGILICGGVAVWVRAEKRLSLLEDSQKQALIERASQSAKLETLSMQCARLEGQMQMLVTKLDV